MSAIQSGAEGTLYPGRDSAAPALHPAWAPPAPAPSLPEPQPQPRRRVRPRSGRSKAAALRRGLLAIALAGGMAALCAVGSVAVAEQGYAVDRAQAEVATLQDANRQDAARLAQLENPQRIQREAVDRLGMHQPAGYVPVAPVQAPPPAPPAPPQTAQAVLPVPAGPAPGGAVADSQHIGAWASNVWRVVGSRLRRG